MSTKEFLTFTNFMDKLVRVPRSTVERAMRSHRKKSAKNPKRRGPKPKGAKDGGASRGSGEGA